YFYPERDGLVVSLKGQELITALDGLEKYSVGSVVDVDGKKQVIDEVIDIDGRKMIFEDGSWLMIRPSGTEPKVRFYVESRSPDGTRGLVRAARNMLEEVGVI
ncbi:MAG TPA: phosphoglucomutase, partial [Desulfopila sp.]|nr:phosphoglucomutase [Desulfopila sp.]